MTENRPLHESKPLHKKEKFFYGFGDLSCNIVWTFSLSWVLYFFTDIYMIGALSAATLILVVRLFDGVKDPIIGLIVDRTDTKYGKARAYLLWFAVPLGIFSAALFFTPNISDAGKIVYAYVTYLLLVIFYSLVNVPYTTMMSLMTKDQNERAQLSKIRGLFNIVAATIVGAVPIIVQWVGYGSDYLDRQRTGYFITAMIFSTIAIAGLLLTFFFSKEHVTTEKKSAKERTPAMLQAKALLKNGQWWVVFFSNVFTNMRVAIISGMSIYYIKYLIGRPDAYATVAMILFVIGMLGGIIPGPSILAKYGYKKSIIYTALLGIGGSLITLFDYSSFALLTIFCLTNGFAQGVPTVSGFAMWADVSEYEEWRSGVRSEGLIFSTYSFAQKLSTAIGGFILGGILVATGYKAGIDIQSKSTLNGMYYIYLSALVVINVLRIIVISFYKIDKQKYDQIVLELEERKASSV